MSKAQDTRIGTTVGVYRIDSLIGRGGMSMVYLAEDPHLGRRVALKFLPTELAQDSQFRERFVRESRLAASLEHPNIVTIYEAREADGELYLAMRYIAGTDLKRLIAAEGSLDPERTISILAQAASALDAAHAEGLIHRDVKPGNILITPRTDPNGRDRVYLSDFGLTKRATSESGITATGQFVGTLDYAAPEQFEGTALDSRADVYSLGCVLYECLTGEVPYPRDNQAALVYSHLHAPPPKATDSNPRLPKDIDAVIARAMAKDAKDRYASAGELADAAAAALGVEVVAPTTPTGWTPTRPVPTPRKSRRRLYAIGAIALAVAIVVVAVLIENGGGGPTGSTERVPSVATDYVARVDPETGKIVARIGVGEQPIDVAVGEGSVWVLDDDGSVSRIDPVTNATTVIPTGAKQARVIATGLGAVWVGDGLGTQVIKIDPASNQVVAKYRTDGTPLDVAVGEGSVWATTRTITLTRLDPESREFVPPASVPLSIVGADVSALLATGNGFVWYATDESAFARFDTRTNQVEILELDLSARGLAVYGQYVWAVACGTPGTVAKFDVRTGALVDTISAGGAVCPYFRRGNRIAIAAGAEGVWVTDGANGTIARIRGVAGQVESPIRIGDSPTAVAVGLGSVWVTVDGEPSPSPSTS
jgi:serine/threonine protein kinase